VLISPHAFGRWDPNGKTLRVNLHKKQIEDSPSLESHQQISRPYEMEYYRYYGWPAYWTDSPPSVLPGHTAKKRPPGAERSIDERNPHTGQHLQSTEGVTGYRLEATDGPVGHVAGFLADDRTWVIQQLIIETGHWHAGKEVVISPSLIERTEYAESSIFVAVTKADLEAAAARLAKPDDGVVGFRN
jgi:hypothetical protein